MNVRINALDPTRKLEAAGDQDAERATVAPGYASLDRADARAHVTGEVAPVFEAAEFFD